MPCLMPRLRLCSTTPMPCLRRRLSTPATSPLSRPSAAFAVATERVRAGTLSPEDARDLFDELLRQAKPVPKGSLNEFLAALARAPPSASLADGPSLAIALFNRVCRAEAGLQVAAPTVSTYKILMDCCCRASRPDLAPAFFGRLLKTGLRTDGCAATTLLKCLRQAKRTQQALDLLQMMWNEGGSTSSSPLHPPPASPSSLTPTPPWPLTKTDD